MKISKLLPKGLINKLKKYSLQRYIKYGKIYEKYKNYTMMPVNFYINTLSLTKKYKNVEGNVVECGVWRGGMIAGMAEVLGEQNRKYFLCDSFEGLPKAKEIDGSAALNWQANTAGSSYYNNCAAEKTFAENAMKLAGVEFELVQGWFDQTLPALDTGPIAFLRLDADWYDSMYCCFQNLYPKVVKNGIILIDDYFQWDGCSKAVHAYLANTPSRIYHFKNGVTYIIKNE